VQAVPDGHPASAQLGVTLEQSGLNNLAKKFFLISESVTTSQNQADGSARVVSYWPYVSVTLSRRKWWAGLANGYPCANA